MLTERTRRFVCLRLLASAVMAAGALPACSGAEEAPDDSIKVGLLLPFTGNASATAANLERAAIYAVDRINAGGGVKGRQVKLIARDTHSEVGRSRAAAAELVADGAVVVLGPESPEIAEELGPYLDAHDTLFLSPLIGASEEPRGECPTPWYRLAPSAKALGEALAREIGDADVDTVGIAYAESDYNEALSDAVASRFQSSGGTVALTLVLDPTAQSYTNDVQQVLQVGVDAIVLATSPRAGALFVNEFDALSAKAPRWFLSPLLKTDLLVQNVAPAALEGAAGIAPRIRDTSDDFPRAFGARWLGDQPLEGAYFYYDAVALVGFALEKAAGEHGEVPDYAALEAALIDAASTQGEATGWNEVEAGLRRIREGADVNYSGLTGPILLDPCGSRILGRTSKFHIAGGRIIDDE